MSVHGICFDEAQAGNCGFKCRGFIGCDEVQCAIREDIIEAELERINAEQKTEEEKMEIGTAPEVKFENCSFGKDFSIKTGENKMFKSPVEIKIVHMVNGKDVTAMSKEELLNCLFDIDKYNRKLEYIQNKANSKAVKKEMENSDKIYKKIVKYLDLM